MYGKSVHGRKFSIVVLAAVTILIYSNTFNSDWHMDDQPNIVNNKSLHIENLMPETIWQTFFSNQGRAEPHLYRPLACLTFAINWYIGKDNVFGYHLVNIGFHVATAIAIYFLFLRLLGLLYRSDKQKADYIHNVSLLAAVLWAINPIQIQAVTYIVQRMAVMAAFFYVLSMHYYVKARTSPSTRQQFNYAFFCILWFLCALGSKENAIVLPFSLVLMEWVFFQKARTDFLGWPTTWVVGSVIVLITIIMVLILTSGNPIESMRGWYHYRPFSLEERLISQPRVVLGYLSQIFYPISGRFSIAHDITLSKSLLHPWPTLPAIGIIISMITSAFLLAKRYPVLSFAILFFFLNHVIESSLLALEIVFEHRNYLPSLFLFLPIASGIYSLLQKIRNDNLFIHGIMVIALTFMIASVGLSTYSRNQAWASGITLWSDAAQKAPNNLRPLVTLGIRLAWQKNPSNTDYNNALRLFRRALELTEVARKTEKAEILGNIASIYFNTGEIERAIETYREALALDQSFLKNRFDLVKSLVVNGNFEKAAHHAEYLVAKRPENPDYLSLLGFIFLWMDKPDEALIYFQKALANVSEMHRPILMLNIGMALTRIGSYENGRWFLQQSIRSSPGDLLPVLGIIENRARASNHNKASEYARRALNRFSVAMIYTRLNADEDFRVAPIAKEYIETFIENELKKIQSGILDVASVNDNFKVEDKAD